MPVGKAEIQGKTPEKPLSNGENGGKPSTLVGSALKRKGISVPKMRFGSVIPV